MSAERSESKITKYMPWLFNPPNTITTQVPGSGHYAFKYPHICITAYQHLQGPKEFLECVSHIRLLSWLLLGAMSHTMMGAGKV